MCLLIPSSRPRSPGDPTLPTNNLQIWSTLNVQSQKQVWTMFKIKVHRCWFGCGQYLYEEELTPVDIPTGILLSDSETKSCEGDCLVIVVELCYQCGERPALLKYCQLFAKLLHQLVWQTIQNTDLLFWRQNSDFLVSSHELCSMKSSWSAIW